MKLPPPSELAGQVRDARQRTVRLVQGLDAEQLMGPRLPIVNPLRWEIGHAAYFHEYWVLRQHLGEGPLRADVDALYDSIAIPHAARWDLPLPSLEETLAYMGAVLERECAHLSAQPEDRERDYLVQYAVFHEDMHTEAFTYSRQTLAYPTPDIGTAPDRAWLAGGLEGDAEIPGGTFRLGASPEDGFCFDNEKWAHPLEVAPFRIARAAVSNTQFARFVADGGYRRRELWDQ